MDENPSFAVGKLPLDIRKLILGKLSVDDLFSAQTVCKVWREDIWKSQLEFSYLEVSPTAQLLRTHQDLFAETLVRLTISPNDHVDVSTLSALQHLNVLDISSNVSDKRSRGVFSFGTKACQNLKTLAAYLPLVHMTTFTSAVESLFPNLERLDLFVVASLGNAAFERPPIGPFPDPRIPTAFPHLNSLYFGAHRIESGSEANLAPLFDVVSRLSELRTLFVARPEIPVELVEAFFLKRPTLDQLVVGTDANKLLARVLALPEDSTVRRQMSNVFVGNKHAKVRWNDGFNNNFKMPTWPVTGSSLLSQCLKLQKTESEIEALVRAGALLDRGKFHLPLSTSLHTASARTVSTPLFKFLLSQPSAAVCLTNYSAKVKSCLMAACTNETECNTLVRLLIEAGASPIFPPENLPYIAATCSAATLEFVLDAISEFVRHNPTKKVNLDAIGTQGVTALAIVGVNLQGPTAWDIISRLIDLGADICAPGEGGISFLHTFVMMGDPVLVKRLLRHPKADMAKQSSAGATPLHITMLVPDILKEALAQPSALNLNEKLGSTYPLLATVVPGLPFESIELVLQHGAQIFGPEILNSAVESRRKDVIDLVLELGGDIDLPQNEAFLTPLFNTSGLCYLPLAEYLLSRNARVDGLLESTATPLFRAALFGTKHGDKCVQYCKFLLEKGADVNRYSLFYVDEHQGSPEEWTPLHASSYGYNASEALTQLFIDFKAKVDTVSKGKNPGVTPLMLAALSNKRGVAEALLNAGADINAGGNSSKSMLVHASIGANIKMNVETFGMLMKRGLKASPADIAAIRSPLLRTIVERTLKAHTENLRSPLCPEYSLYKTPQYMILVNPTFTVPSKRRLPRSGDIPQPTVEHINRVLRSWHRPTISVFDWLDFPQDHQPVLRSPTGDFRRDNVVVKVVEGEATGRYGYIFEALPNSQNYSVSVWMSGSDLDWWATGCGLTRIPMTNVKPMAAIVGRPCLLLDEAHPDGLKGTLKSLRDDGIATFLPKYRKEFNVDYSNLLLVLDEFNVPFEAFK